jgi:hypothetical protein
MTVQGSSPLQPLAATALRPGLMAPPMPPSLVAEPPGSRPDEPPETSGDRASTAQLKAANIPKRGTSDAQPNRIFMRGPF